MASGPFYQEEADRLGARIDAAPGCTGPASTPIAPPRQAAVNLGNSHPLAEPETQLIAPNRARAAGEQSGAFARRAGQNLRTGAVAAGNAGLANLETAVNTNPVVSLVRNTANATQQFNAGFSDQAAPPDIAPLELPRLRDRGPGGVAVTPAGGPKRPARVRGGDHMAGAFDRSRSMPAAPANACG